MYDLIYVLSKLQEEFQIVHRDIKPSNILVFPNNVVKLSDFGCSKQYDLSDLTKTKTMIGTANFLSPQARRCYEVMTGNSEESLTQWDYFKSDVFSLGLTLLYTSTFKMVGLCNMKKDRLEE
jgi:serine/threonine protein kinase